MYKFLLLFFVLSLSGFKLKALSLEEARSKGFVCEGTDGLLTPVDSPTIEVEEFINKINTQRQQEYKKIQESHQGTTLEQIKGIAGQKIISSVPPETFIMDRNGNCNKKP